MIKRAFAIFSLAILGGVLLYNCEPEPDSLGEQLFIDDSAQGNERSFDVIAYNINNNDSIRSDASQLGAAVLGAFKEGQFGMQRASYVTQLRLSAYNPDFGTNAKVDSVVLVIKPTVAMDSLTTTTNEDYVYPDGNVAAKKEVRTYPMNKYGKAKKTLTLNVHEVTDFLRSSTDSVKSNIAIAYDNTLIGSKVLNGTASTVAITRDSDNGALFTTTVPGIRIELNKDLFQNKIINMKGKPELMDAANFIRHFRGLRVSVQEDDGYLFQFNPNDMELIMYYKSEKTENGTTTTPQSTYTFALGAGNTHIGQYEYDRSGAALSSATMGNTTTGDSKLYTQGMGGPSIGIKIPAATVNELKSLYQTEKAAIISAKIRMYTDDSVWNNNYRKPTSFTFLQKDKDNATGPVKTTFTSDLTTLGRSPGFSIYRAFDLDKNPAYYEFNVTVSLKNLVEAGADNTYKYYRIDMGGFLSNADNSGLLGPRFTSRAYARDRAVFVGTSNAGDERRVRLRVTYGTR